MGIFKPNLSSQHSKANCARKEQFNGTHSQFKLGFIAHLNLNGKFGFLRKMENPENIDEDVFFHFKDLKEADVTVYWIQQAQTEKIIFLFREFFYTSRANQTKSKAISIRRYKS